MATTKTTTKQAKTKKTTPVDAPATTPPSTDTTTPSVDATTPVKTPNTTTTTPVAAAPVVLKTNEDVAKYLATPDVSIKDKLSLLCKEAPIPIRTATSSLVAYAEEFDTNMPDREPNYVLGKLFNLYNTMKSIVETVDSSEYAVKMDILNLVFLAYGSHGQAYYPTMLLRYDYLWSWGQESLKTHQVLCTVISSLAKRSTRNEELQKININNSFARSGLSISQDNIERIIRYYS